MDALQAEQKALVKSLQTAGVVPESVGCALFQTHSRRLSTPASRGVLSEESVRRHDFVRLSCRQELLRAMLDLKDEPSGGAGSSSSASRRRAAGQQRPRPSAFIEGDELEEDDDDDN